MGHSTFVPQGGLQARKMVSEPLCSWGKCGDTDKELLINRQRNTRAPTGVAQFVDCHPAKQKVTGSIPGRAHAWDEGQSQVGVCASGNRSTFVSHVDVSFPLFLPPFPFI